MERRHPFSIDRMYFSHTKKKRNTQVIILVAICLSLYLLGPWIQKQSCERLPAIVVAQLCFQRPTSENWNLFYHLGGNGPWIKKVDGVVGKNTPLPPGCAVDQVHMLSRHAERYPTRAAGARHLELLERMKSAPKLLRGSLNFVKHWEYFTDPNNPDFERLTSTGPYAGTREAFMTGQKLQKRYAHLVSQNATTHFWSCDSDRDIETAKHFADGFFGENWSIDDRAKLHVVPETQDRGGDTLTPGDTCTAYIEDKEQGHDQGYQKLAEWQITFSEAINRRLRGEVPGIDLRPIDIYSMMEMCGFELLVRGSSPWCDVFSQEEWLDFEYGRDLLHFYRAGPGNKYAGAMGLLWLDATQSLMNNNSARGVYFSFAHDGDLVPLLAALELLNEKNERIGMRSQSVHESQFLPSDHRKDDRNWKTSDIVPMGGRIIFERIDCRPGPRLGDQNRIFVRVLINDGHVQLQNDLDKDLLQYDMRLDLFGARIDTQKRKFGGFNEICGLDDSLPSRISFLHQ